MPKERSWLHIQMRAVGRGDGVVLETDRLVLRRLTLEDLDAMSSFYADPAVRRFFPEGTLTREETLEELEWILDVYYERYGYGLWATVDKRSGDVIGRCGLLPFKVVRATTQAGLALEDPDEHPSPDDRYEVEVAYLLARDRWGRGFATEAAAAIVAYGFEHLEVERSDQPHRPGQRCVGLGRETMRHDDRRRGRARRRRDPPPRDHPHGLDLRRSIGCAGPVPRRASRWCW